MRFRNRVPRSRTWTGIVAIVFVLAFLLPPFYGCEPKDEFLVEQMVKASEGATISSGDNRITLEIPPDAMSENTRVRLSTVPEEEWADDIREMEPLGTVYRLEPDGTQLDKPATLTIRLEPDDLTELELPEGALPVCIMITRSKDGEWDALDNQVTEIGTDTGALQITGNTTHFSEEFIEGTTLAVSFEPPSATRGKNESWFATLSIRNRGHEEMPEWWRAYSSKMSITGINSSGWGSVSSLSSDLSDFDLARGEERDKRFQYKCKEEGKGNYVAQFRANTVFFVYRKTQSGLISFTAREGSVGVVLNKDAKCNPPAPKEQATCELTFNPDPYDFGDVCVGASKRMKVTVTNGCDFDVTVTDYKWPDAPFEVVSTVPRNLTLAPKQSYEYTIEFTPPSAGNYAGLFGVSVEFEHLGEHRRGAFYGELSGTGVACEQQASALSIDGSPSCTPTATGSQLDLQKIKVSSKTPIAEVTYSIDGEVARSFGDISATEWPPPPGMILRRITEPGLHTQCVKAVNIHGQEAEQCWETYCSGEPTGEQPVSICPKCGIPSNLCPCPK